LNIDLPWLQDNFAEYVQNDWDATYRDVIILDPLNRPLDPPVNLTNDSLALVENREALKQRLREAAQFLDTDDDGMGDDWEERFLGGLGQAEGDDPDTDGENLFLEFALADPPLAREVAGPTIRVSPLDGEGPVIISHRRRLGAAGGIEYVLQRKEPDHQWTDVSDDFTLTGSTNPYDGTGTEIVTWQAPLDVEGAGLLRLLVRRGDSE